jgi:glycosyltransferase involved in cell wall biosynthesis
MFGTRGMPATHGGVERAVEELSARLAARGHEVTVFCRNNYCADRRPAHRGVRLRYLPAVPTKHLEAASHSILAALAAAAGPYDVVHVHSIGPALFSWIPRLAGKRVIATVHALDWGRRKWGAAAAAVLRIGARAAARFPHATIVVSRAAGRWLEERHGRVPVYLPNGVTAPAAVPVPATPAGAPTGPYILYLGRLVPEKRVEDLIVAFRRSSYRGRLVIAGEGSFADPYVEALRRHAQGDPRVLFAGAVYGGGKEGLLSGAAALVNPSELEGHPIAVLEALAHGVPVLLSDIAEHREILEGEGAPPLLGATFKVRDPLDLARCLRRLPPGPQDDPARRVRRDHVRRRFDWDRIADATIAVYSGPGPAPSPGVHGARPDHPALPAPESVAERAERPC